VHVASRFLARDPAALAVRERDLAVERGRGLEPHPWPPVPHAMQESAVRLLGFGGHEADLHLHARLAQAREAAALDLGIRILERRDYAGDPRFDQRLAARARAPAMAARLERHVDRRPGGGLRRGIEGLALRVRLARALVPPLADDPPVLRDHAAHIGIGRGRVASQRRQRQRARHEGVILLGEHYLSRTSRIASRKSSTSWKLR
jgi:hypothetical protein